MDSSLSIQNFRVEADSDQSDVAVRDFHYNPGLDAMRGIAVLSVMLYHLGIFLNEFTPILIGGFLGVDIFFVLSGFLITSVLLRERSKTGTINLKNFYWRRIYRLVPAYWLFLFVLVVFGWLLLPDAQVAELYRGNKFLLAVTYLTNWNSAYGVAGGNLNHTWSLSIEEQFYLLWPVTLALIFWRRRNTLSLVIITVLAIALLTLFRVARVDSGTPVSVLYYSTESRIDSILIGCLASLAFMNGIVSDKILRSKTFSILTILATCIVVWIMSSLDEKNPESFRTFISLFSISTAILILWLVGNVDGPFSWFFGNRYLQWVGKISYGLYLWHYLAFEISRQIFSLFALQVVFGILLAFAVASSSFYFLEQRFLTAKRQLEV